ncbi:MAG: enoyl-CoA hydratase/isomerase family protein [Desulfitobacterium sp.]
MAELNNNHLIYEKSGVLATLTLNRPDALNAFSLPMLKGWVEALTDAQADPNIRVVIVKAAGKAFCAGGDIKSMLAGEGFIADDENGECWGAKAINRKGALMNYIHKVALTLEAMDKPVLCAINGVAVGAGLDMALMCDLRIASESAQLSGGYVKAGLVPGDGGCYFMPRLVGVAKALELLWTADFITAEEALRIGMINKIVPAEELEKATLELANKIAANPPVCVQMIKRAVYSSQRNHDLRTALDMISSHMAIVTEMEDYKEGVSAIQEKRKPVFKGE